MTCMCCNCPSFVGNDCKGCCVRFLQEKAQPRKTSFSRLCSKRGLCCAFLLVVVAVVVISSLSTKDGSASQSELGVISQDV